MPDPESLRVLVADDSWHYADALALGLSRAAGIMVTGTAYDAEEALRVARETSVDVVLVDLDLPPMGGVELCRRLTALEPAPAVVVVTVSVSEADARESLAAGARAYVVKEGPSDPARVAHAIQAAARGDHVLDRRIHGLIGRLASMHVDPASQAGLTPREREVLPLLVMGRSNKEIAAELGIGVQGVKNHVRSILRKLRAGNRTEAADQARRRGLVD